MNRAQKRKLERDLAKQPKDVRELVKVWRMENSPNGDIPVYAFMTYGWTFPLYWSQQGKIKSGVSNDPFDDGTTRMKQACSKKTDIAEQPRVIKELKQVWEIPVELVGLDKSKANKIRNIFDSRCNKALSKYKVKDATSPLVGEEWYREISIEEIKALRTKIWEELLIELGTKAIEKVYKKMSPKGLQTPAIKAIIKEFKEYTSRFKGIAPTGFGKTVVAFLTITKLKAHGLLKNRVVMMAAPNQFLANKNAAAFDEYAIGNKVKGIYNIPVFSGSDLGFAESHIEVLERNEKLASIIQGYLQDDPTAIIVLHTCNPSVQLVDEVLDSIGINEIDFAICDEAHTLASTYDSRWNFVLQDDKVKIKSRFFLTATEKTLSNPDFLEHVPNRGNRVAKFNYMNNKDIFGDYCFKFSFAQGVDAGHIVPMIAKVFEYSNSNSAVSDMLSLVDSLDIPELQDVKDELGRTVLFDKKLARTLVSIMSIFEKEDRNKLLTICSRNSHVDLLVKVVKAIQSTGKYLQDIEVTDIKACDHLPAERQAMLDVIHDSDKKQIVITGPWSITGVDCPSIDAVHWNFTPGTEISITQGTGRGARLSEGKKNVLVSFNLDLNNHLAALRSKISSTVVKLYESQFPSHDVELSTRVRRIVGRTFLSVEKDTEGDIPSSIRLSIDQIYEASSGINFKQFIDSFRNRSTQEELEILAEEFRSTYDSTLLYHKESLVSEILKSSNFKKLINIKLTKVVIDKLLELVESEYNIKGTYSGFNSQLEEDIIPLIVFKLAKKHSVNFLGLKVVNMELIKQDLQKEIIKAVFAPKRLNTILRTSEKYINGIIKINHIFIPVFGGKRKDARDIFRPALFNEAKKRCNLETIYDYDNMKDCLKDVLNNPKFAFLLRGFGDRTTSEEWRQYCRAELGDDKITEIAMNKALQTKKERYGDDLSGINYEVSEETREKLRQSTRNWMLSGGAKMLSEKGNSEKIICPDGHITSKQNAERYCKSRDLDYSKCKEETMS